MRLRLLFGSVVAAAALVTTPALASANGGGYGGNAGWNGGGNAGWNGGSNAGWNNDGGWRDGQWGNHGWGHQGWNDGWINNTSWNDGWHTPWKTWYQGWGADDGSWYGWGRTDCSPLDDGSAASGPNAAGVSWHDVMFLRQAAVAGMLEIQSSQKALQVATTPQAKAFAQQMIADHTAQSQQLATVAARYGVTLPTKLPCFWGDLSFGVGLRTGLEADRYYMELQTMAHYRTILKFMDESVSGQAADVRAFASSSLPVLAEHFRMASTLWMQLEHAVATGGTWPPVTTTTPATPASPSIPTNGPSSSTPSSSVPSSSTTTRVPTSTATGGGAMT